MDENWSRIILEGKFNTIFTTFHGSRSKEKLLLFNLIHFLCTITTKKVIKKTT